jgi:hypothetical protein
LQLLRANIPPWRVSEATRPGKKAPEPVCLTFSDVLRRRSPDFLLLDREKLQNWLRPRSQGKDRYVDIRGNIELSISTA